MEASALPDRLNRSRAPLSAAFLRLRSDEQLVALFRGGSDDAFRAIHDRYRARLLAYARQMLHGALGDPCLVRGTVKDLNGAPIAGAVLEVWQADAAGYYDVQYPDLETHQARGILKSQEDGSFEFRTVVAVAYPIPTDGPVGDLLRATGRHPWRPAHLHFMIKAKNYETLVTHVFRNGDQYLDSDAVFGVRQTLVADWIKQPDGDHTLNYDFVLNPVG